MKRFVFILFCILLVITLFTYSRYQKKSGRWVCQNNQWIKENNPSYPKPSIPCGSKKSLPKTKEACIAEGGIWKKLGPEPFETCNMKALDRGNICTDNSECEGWCQANLSQDDFRKAMKGRVFEGKGQCSVWRVEIGCFGMLEKGKISVICID